MLFPLSFLDSTCTIQRRYRKQKFTYSASSGTPAVGQTITGQTSAKTAVIDRLGSGYLVVKTLSGTFTPGETITVGTSPVFTFCATFGVATDYQNQSGEYEYYWTNDQTSVSCRFGYSGREKVGVSVHDTGELLDLPMKIALPDTITLVGTQAGWAENYRIVSTTTGFYGTFQILVPRVVSGLSGIDHYSFILKEVQ
jgi:hypothetical protein